MKKVKCYKCNGKGYIPCPLEYGDEEHPESCPVCGGDSSVRVKCDACEGTGRIEE
jgi:DnaJ-class molecular chaperone